MTTTTPHSSEAAVQAEELDILKDLGWEFKSRKELSILRGPARRNEAIVEPLLVRAVIDLNVDMTEETAREIAAQVRHISSDHEMLNVLRNGVPYKAAPDAPTVDIAIIDSSDPSRNSYVVTEELALKTGGAREPRLDVICLVNGLPLGVIENKDIDEPLAKAADDWAGYWQDVPQLVAQTSVVACCNGLKFRVGPSGLEDLDDYLEWSDPWPYAVPDADDEMRVGLTAFHPYTIVDLATNFVIFETREGVTSKKLARAHQYRAANKLVERVVEGKLDRGIVWHATGSGKSLTMLFAAQKLLRVGLGDPTVLLIVDRKDLDEQINETLTACEFDAVRRPANRTALAQLLRDGGGGVVVTTTHKFDESMAGLLPDDKVIAFVDECHRTQFGDLGMFMRTAMPNARLFGFTGTPIEQGGKLSTRKWFSVELPDGTWEPYLDRYGFDQAIADGATVPVVYEPRMADWRMSKTDLDVRFDELTDGMSEAERDALREHATREKVVAKAPDRVKAVAADIAQQLTERIAPYAGLYAGVDREDCALIAEALSNWLKPEEFAVVMSRSKKDSAQHGLVDLRKWYPAVHWERVHGQIGKAEDDGAGDIFESEDEFSAATDRAAIKDYVKRLKNDDDPLRLLIVNSMLLTGFDSPPVKALFLDRGLRGHTLMQAIARTNRRYPGKDFGMVLDYWGVFDNLSDALKEFAADDLAGLVEQTGQLIDRLPTVLDEALAVVAGAPKASARKRMLWIVRHLTDNPNEAERFANLVEEAQATYEGLSPDPRLLPYLPRYRDLMEVWVSWRRGSRLDRRTTAQMRRKTEELVQNAISFERLRTDLPARVIDADFLTALQEDEDLTPDEKATDIDAALTHEVKVRGEDDPIAHALAERLVRLRQKRDKQAQMTLAGLKEWEDLVGEHVAKGQEAKSLGLDDAGALAYAVLRQAAPGSDHEEVLAVAQAISAHYGQTAGFGGWSERADIEQSLRRSVIIELVAHDTTRRLAREAQVVDDILAALATLDRPQT